MPGSGKSFVGKKIADKLGYKFIESDKILESEYGLPLHQVLEKLGEQSFLNREAEIIISHTSSQNNFVVSPGGSIIYKENAMRHLKEVSMVFYLNVSLEVIERRIRTVPRGIIGPGEKTLAQLYTERIPLYEKWADYMIDADLDSEVVVVNILRVTDSYTSDGKLAKLSKTSSN